MNKTIIPIILGIFLLSFTTALTLNSGDSHTWNLDNEFVNYSISGNSSNLEGLNFTNTINSLTVNIAQNYKPDNWTIKITTKEEVIEKRVGGGGGTFIPKPISKEEVREGVRKTLRTDDSYHFEINGNTHEYTLLNVTETSATIRIRSEEIIINLNVGETKTVCLDNKEVKVTLERTSVYETVSYAETTLQSTNIECGIIESEEEPPVEPSESKEPENSWIWIMFSLGIILVILGIILVIVGIVRIIIIAKRRKKTEESKETKK